MKDIKVFSREFFWITIGLVVSFLLTSCSSGPDIELTYQVGYRGPDKAVRLMLASIDGSSSEDLFPEFVRSAVAVWSPDGSKLITYGYEGPPYPYEYYIHDFGGDSPICLTCELEEFGNPVWSKTGEHIAIPTENTLILFDANGSISTIVDLDGPPFWTSWSPDDQDLVFSVESPQGFLIYRVNTDGTDLVNLSDILGNRPGFTFGAQWCPIENLIAYHSIEDGPHVVLINSDGGERRELASWETKDQMFDPGLQWPPQWSPDGEKIAFASVSPFGDLDIFIIDLDGSGPVNISSHPGEDYMPVWSPDGQLIAFVSTRDGDEEVYVMNADGSNQINISHNPGVTDINPSWRNTGTKK